MARIFARAAAAAICVVAMTSSPATATQPVARWSFNEGSGVTARDSGGLNLDGTLGGVGIPTWITGVRNTALRFAGSGYVRVPDHVALEPARITVAAWVRATTSPGRFRYVFSKGGSSCTRSAYGLYSATEGGAAFYVAGDGLYTVSAQVDPAAVWDGRWHRLVGTYDGSQIRLFLDGVRVGQGTAAPTHIEYGLTSRAPYIGTYRGDCDLPFNGDIDELGLWSTALSPAEIQQDSVPPAETPVGEPVGPSPGRRLTPTELAIVKGKSTTPAPCTSVSLDRRTVRRRARSTVRATVRRGGSRLSGARVVLRAGKLRKATRTNARGRARFEVRARRAHKRLRIRVATRRVPGCGTPVAFVRVRR